MSEKYYKPIVKPGDHLASSKKTPGRVRGVSFDEDNKNPDIVEWEEVEVEDPSVVTSDVERQVMLSPEEERLAKEIGDALGQAAYTALELFNENVVLPWWQNTALPGIQKGVQKLKDRITGKKGSTPQKAVESIQVSFDEDPSLPEVTEQIDSAFDQFTLNMDIDEARTHVMSIIYHMLAIADEIRILSNAQLKKQSESEEQYISRKSNSEKYLVNTVSNKINDLLSDESLSLDVGTSKTIFGLFGGGVRMNGEYVSVEEAKVRRAIQQQGQIESIMKKE